MRVFGATGAKIGNIGAKIGNTMSVSLLVRRLGTFTLINKVYFIIRYIGRVGVFGKVW